MGLGGLVFQKSFFPNNPTHNFFVSQFLLHHLLLLLHLPKIELKVAGLPEDFWKKKRTEPHGTHGNETGKSNKQFLQFLPNDGEMTVNLKSSTQTIIIPEWLNTFFSKIIRIIFHFRRKNSRGVRRGFLNYRHLTVKKMFEVKSWKKKNRTGTFSRTSQLTSYGLTVQ